MRKIISWILVCSTLLMSCSPKDDKGNITTTESVVVELDTPISVSEYSESLVIDENAYGIDALEEYDDGECSDVEIDINDFDNLSDAELLSYVEDSVYEQLAEEFPSDQYVIEDVSAVYISNEYIEELTYSSMENVYYGYTLSEVEEVFQDQKYIFTLGEDGKTIVTEFEAYDDALERIIKNVAIGTGVILVFATISVVTAGTAPAISVICAASAKTGLDFALSTAVISGSISAGVTLYETGDVNAAMKSFAVEGSEGFKCGSITGVCIGGLTEATLLKMATKNGLKMNEVAAIAQETQWPYEYIKYIHSAEEAQVYIDAGLVPTTLKDGTVVLLRNDIIWEQKIDGLTNLERIAQNKSPVDLNGVPYELHHVGMNANSPLAILSREEHHSKDIYKYLHYKEEGKNISKTAWETQKKSVWSQVGELFK